MGERRKSKVGAGAKMVYLVVVVGTRIGQRLPFPSMFSIRADDLQNGHHAHFQD